MTDSELIERITDLLEGTIDHLDKDDALDLLYEIKHLLKYRRKNK